MHEVEFIPVALDLPAAKNQVVKNHLPATEKKQAAKNQAAHNLE